MRERTHICAGMDLPKPDLEKMLQLQMATSIRTNSHSTAEDKRF